MARGDVPVAERVEGWIDDVAVACLEPRAARMEVARARRVQRARHVALEHDRLAGATTLGIGDRNGGEQRSRIRVLGLLVELQLWRQLDDLAEVHDEDAVGDVPDDVEVVGDEDVRQSEILL